MCHFPQRYQIYDNDGKRVLELKLKLSWSRLKANAHFVNLDGKPAMLRLEAATRWMDSVLVMLEHRTIAVMSRRPREHDQRGVCESYTVRVARKVDSTLVSY